jgi:hypothetical protein
MSTTTYLSDLWNWLKRNWLWAIAYFGVALYFVVQLFPHLVKLFTNLKCPANLESSLGDALILPVFVLLAVAFVHIFTTPIPLPPAEHLTEDKKQEIIEENNKYKLQQRRQWMIFSYSFMLFSMLATFYVFGTGWKQNTSGNVSAPIAVFLGCSESSESDVPKELACFPKNKGAGTSSKNPTDSKSPGSGGNSPPPPVPTAGVNPSAGDASKPRGAYVLNIGGHVTECLGQQQMCRVSGGLLVPLYVIILALMGGSISLTRRLPEYQVRSGPEYVATEKDPKLTQHQFREYLVFQIVQFLSAPLIAVLAYYLITPDKLVTSVALAFTAGFASESILLMVRSVAEKITPTLTTEPKFGTVSGVVTVDGKPVDKAEVCLAAQSSVRTITDKSGHYVLSNVPVGEHGIKVVYQENAQQPKLEKSETVRIERAQEVVSKNVALEKKVKDSTTT